MFQNKKISIYIIFFLIFFLFSCSKIPFIGKKEEKVGKVPQGKTVTIEGMEKIKGVNPPRAETPLKKPPSPIRPKKEIETKVSSIPAKPFYSPAFPFFQVGFKRKVVILEFENKTTYKEEKLGEAVSKKLSDKLEASHRVAIVDPLFLSDLLKRENFSFQNLSETHAMKKVHKSFGIQAFLKGMITELSLLTSKASETSEEEVSFATAKVEIHLIDASTGNLLRSFIGRSPIFGTKETGEYSRSKAVLKAIDFCLDDIIDGLLRQLDILEWTTTIAKIEGENIFINAGKLSGLRVGDTLEIYEPGKEIIHQTTNYSLGWTTGKLKGVIRIVELFGIDGAIGKVVQGDSFTLNDVVKSMAK